MPAKHKYMQDGYISNIFYIIRDLLENTNMSAEHKYMQVIDGNISNIYYSIRDLFLHMKNSLQKNYIITYILR